MDNTVINTISLFSGVGMLDEGLHAGLGFMGIRSRTVMYAEREAYPVSVLEARMEEGSLPPAPIWFGDLCELDASQFHGVVDCIAAGFPCQDLSLAGRRAGLQGARSGLFYQVIRIANESNAQFMLLENVSGLYSADGYSARCVCGWDHRWGGIDQHTKAWGGSGGCGHGGEGDTDPELAIQDIRGKRKSNRARDGEVASTVLLDDHDRSGDLFSCSDSSIHDHQERNCDRNTEGGFGGQRPVARQAQAVDSGSIPGIRGGKDCRTEGEQEGATTRARGLDCPSCGEPLGEQAGEPFNGAFRDVLWELAANGFDAEWTCLPASDVGASHGRARWFCWAWREVGHAGWNAGSAEHGQQPQSTGGRAGEPGEAGDGALQGCEVLGEPESIRRPARRAEHAWQQRRTAFAVPGGEVADTENHRHQPGARLSVDRECLLQAEQSIVRRGTGGREPGRCCADVADTDGIGRWPQSDHQQQPSGLDWRKSPIHGSPIFAPGPADPAWPRIIQQWPHLAPALEPGFHSMADGLAYDMDDCRPQRLKCCGNGVVAGQAAFALVGLVRRMCK